jgi:hypothetical protein
MELVKIKKLEIVKKSNTILKIKNVINKKCYKFLLFITFAPF